MTDWGVVLVLLIVIGIPLSIVLAGLWFLIWLVRHSYQPTVTRDWRDSDP